MVEWIAPTCSKPGCKDINHANTLPPVTKSCEVQPRQAAKLGPRSSSSGKVLQLPLDSCFSFTLCSLDQAQHIHSARSKLKNKKLEKPIPVQIADTSASLNAVAFQEAPIAWLSNKETVHVALVVPNTSWPLLFGENLLAATHPLSDHREKTVTLRHPAMNSTISCDKAPVSQEPHAAVTCLLTRKPNSHAAPTKTTVYRSLNLLTVYFTLSAASIGLLGNVLWLTGHELAPGIRVHDGIFHASALRTVMDFPPDTGTSVGVGDLPDFEQLRAMNVLVQCTKKSARTDHSTFGYLSPCTAESKADFQDALHHTADILSSSIDACDSLFCQSPVDASPLTKTPSSSCFSKRDPVKPHFHKQANQEMITARLVQSSRLRHPFNQPDDMDDRDPPPPSVVELDPF